MKKKSILITTVFVIALPALIMAGQTSAFQRDTCMNHGGFKGHPAMQGMAFNGHHMFRLMEALDLGKAQQEKLWNIIDENRSKMRTQMMSLFEGRKQLRNTAIDGGYDEIQVRKLADAQGKAMADLIVLRTQTRAQIQSMLTPEQQAKFKELRDQRRSKFLED